ncbi:CotH kinase family protein [bacterium]|nr:CotH kinase family protein [bacterium]
MSGLRRITEYLALTALSAALFAPASCAGPTAVTEPAPTSKSTGRRQALAELDRLRPGPQVWPALHEQLAAELRRVLAAQDDSRFISAAPQSALSQVDDLAAWPDGEGGMVLRWTYRNQGDYNQDSLVSVNDLTPIGQHYLKNTTAADWLLAQQADGNRDGEVNVSDITPIGQQFSATVGGYLLESSADGESGWQAVAEVPFAASEVLVPSGPRRFSYSLTAPAVGAWYRVTPVYESAPGIAGAPALYTGDTEPPVVVSGTCTNDVGDPLAGVELKLTGLPAVLSGDDGTFAIEVAGDYQGVLTPLMAGRTFTPASRVVIVTGADVPGQDFVSSALPEYRLYLDPADIAALDEELWAADYKPGVFVAGDVRYEDVGLKYRGGAAQTFPKKSWKVSFNEDHEFDDPAWGYRRGKLNLNAEYTDTTLMREQLTYDLMHDLGMLAPRSRFVRVYVNDEYAGLFVDVENPRRGWLDEFGLDNSGALYQAAISRFHTLETSEEYAEAFDKELREDEPYDDIIALIEDVNGWTDGELYQRYPERLDLEQFQRYMVVYCLVTMADHIETNYYLYNDINGTGKWWIIPWDHDRTWGHRYDPELGFFSLEINYTTAIDYGSFDANEAGGEWGNVLYDRYLNDAQYWGEFTDELLYALDNYFSEERMVARIDGYEALITDAALEDTHKWGDNADYAQRVDDLREYVPLRHGFIRDSIANWPVE